MEELPSSHDESPDHAPVLGSGMDEDARLAEQQAIEASDSANAKIAALGVGSLALLGIAMLTARKRLNKPE